MDHESSALLIHMRGFDHIVVMHLPFYVIRGEIFGLSETAFMHLGSSFAESKNRKSILILWKAMSLNSLLLDTRGM